MTDTAPEATVSYSGQISTYIYLIRRASDVQYYNGSLQFINKHNNNDPQAP